MERILGAELCLPGKMLDFITKLEWYIILFRVAHIVAIAEACASNQNLSIYNYTP